MEANSNTNTYVQHQHVPGIFNKFKHTQLIKCFTCVGFPPNPSSNCRKVKMESHC